MYPPRRAMPGERLPLATVTDESAPRHADLVAATPVDADEPVARPRHQADESLPAAEPDFAEPRAPWLRLVAAPLAVLAVAGVTVGAVMTSRDPQAAAPAVTPSNLPSVSVSSIGHQVVSRELEGARPAVGSAAPSTPAASSPAASPSASTAATAKAAPKASAKAPAAKAKATAEPSGTVKARETVKASTTAKAITTAKATPSPVSDRLGEVVGTRYASTSVRIRTQPSTEAEQKTVLAEGAKVTITDRTSSGWRQVKLDDGAGWVREQYLVAKKPAASTSTGSKGTQSSAGGAISSAPCASGSAVESGLTGATIAVHRAVCNAFPSIRSYGGLRPGDGGAHGQGRALDVMTSGETGWAIARWARANAGRLGITEVIYSQQIWTTQRSSEGWRPMSDRGGATANHFDHVHITVG